MVNANTNLVGLLLPLAQRLLKADGEGLQERLDPRFSSLRREEWRRTSAEMLEEGTPHFSGDPNVWELDVTLGAIVRAVAACGFEITYLASPNGPSNPSRMWECSMIGSGGGFTTPGENPEEAMARAMVELLDLTERWGVTV